MNFSINEALAAALDDIERAGVLPGIPLPLKPTIRSAFEEAIYALADHAQRYGEIPREFRFYIAPTTPRALAAEQDMIAINHVLERAKKKANLSRG